MSSLIEDTYAIILLGYVVRIRKSYIKSDEQVTHGNLLKLHCSPLKQEIKYKKNVFFVLVGGKY